MKLRTSALILAVAAGMVSGPALAKPKTDPKAPAPYTTGVQFAHLHSDIAPDPGVRFGWLPNGLTYMISRTPQPAGGAVMQMRIDGGYLDEAEDEQGLSLMLARLAFDGSSGIKAKSASETADLHSWLAAHGLDMRLGSDVTLSPDAVKYQIDLPKADRQGIDDGLFVLRQVAGELTLSKEAVTREGLASAGMALSSAGQMRPMDELRKWVFQGQAYGRRSMMGAQDVVMYTDAARMTSFYNARYRPETTTLIVAGDVDPDLVEQRLKAAFGDWKAKGAAAAPAAYGEPAAGPRAKVISLTGAPQIMALSWNRPADDSFQTQASARRANLTSIAAAAFNQRLARQALDPQSHFLQAELDRDEIVHTAVSYTLMVQAKPGEDEAALKEVLAAVAQLRAYGVNPSEIEVAYDTALSAGSRRLSQGDGVDAEDRVALLSASMDGKAVVNSAQQDLDFLKGLKPDLTPQVLTPLLAEALSGDPSIALLGQGYGDLDEDKVLADYRVAEQARPQPPADIARVAWPYTDFGAATQVVKEETFARSGVTHLRYGNGVDVYLRPRSDAPDDIAVRVTVRGGNSLFPADTKAPVFISHQPAFLKGSLGKLSYSDTDAILAGRKATVGVDVQDTVTALSGRTGRKDLEFQLQALMAYLTDYRLTDTEFARAQSSLNGYYTLLSGNAGALMASQANRLLHGDDRRFGVSSPAEAAAMTRADAQGVFDKVLGGGPVTVSIAGDFDPADVRALLDRTFAALPSRPAAPALDPARFATRLDRTMRYRTDSYNSLFVLAWPTTDYYGDVKTSVALRVMIRVLDERFFAAHREDYGMTSDAMFDNWQSNDRPGDGYLSVSVPSLLSGDDSHLAKDVAAAFDDMLAHPATEAELTRARAWLVHYNDGIMRDNAYWAIEMSHFNHPDGEADLTDYNAMVQATTPADVDKVAKAYLKTGDTMHLRLVPLDTSGGNAS